METALTDFQTHIEEVARRAGAEAAREAIQNLPTPPPTPTQKKNLVDVKQLAKETGVSIPTLIRRRNDGTITGYRFGGRVLYNLDEVLESMQSTRRV